MCAFFNFRGGFCNFPISISPRPSNAKRTNFARVCKAKKKIDRADLLATTHREINSFFVERKYKTYPAISRLLPMRMQRNSSSFGRRDDETEDRKEIYLSILFFRTFLRRFSKNYTTTLLDPRKNAGHFFETRLEKERVRVREKTRGVSQPRRCPPCSSSFVVKRYELKILFFCLSAPDRWSLVWFSNGKT